MKNFTIRTITGFLLVILIISALFFSSLSFAILFFFILLGTLHEFYSMIRRGKIHPQTIYGMAIAGTFYILCFLNSVGFIETSFLLLVIPLMIMVYISELFYRENRPFHNIAYTFLGLIYIGLPFSLFHYMVFETTESLNIHNGENVDIVNFIFQPEYRVNYHYQVLLGFFFLHWMNDTGAYLVGMTLGRHKLIKRISPKKSWEGLIGGALFALLTGYLLSRFFPMLGLVNWLAISVIVIVFGTLGDLSESMLKRYLGLKDSGSILPGHGGLLDRFDGILLSSPVVFVFLQMIY